MTDWMRTPRYQRAIERIAKMSPQQRTILDSLELADSELEPRALSFYLRSLTSEYP